MIQRLSSSQLFFVAMVIASFFTCVAEAAPRIIVIPGSLAIILMEGVSSGGQDPDPQRLYNTIAMPASHQQDGDGKVMATDAGDFNLACAVKSVPVNNVVCTINIKPSPHTKMGFQKVEFHVSGADAKQLNDKLAGSQGTFSFETSNHGVKIESTLESFDFSAQP
jgi:hypothetical protein